MGKPIPLSSEVKRVTQRIVENSKVTREHYLQRMAKAASSGRTRSSLSCGNLAHAMAVCNERDKKLMAGEESANLAIINAYNDMLSAHKPYEHYPQLIKKTAARYGVTAQVAGGVPAMCDGVTQGQPGMEMSLFSRDLIAMSTAVSLSHNVFDGILCLGVCDKIVPGLLIGALSFGHLPAVFVPAGPMSTGQSNSKKAKVRQAYAEGKASRQALLASESESYHGEGTCTFYGTANSNQMLMEIMGLHLPGSSFVPPDTQLRQSLTMSAVEKLIAQINHPDKGISLAEVVSEKSIVNGMVGLLATGGSTNHAIHLVAIARAAGIIIDWQDMADLSRIVPLLCRIYPNGDADINQFQAAGGMGFLMRELSQSGYLHQDVKTIMGDGLSAYFYEPQLVRNNHAEIFRQKNDTTLSQHNIEWGPVTTKSYDPSVLTGVDSAFSQEGGLKLLTGNIGRSVIKVSAVADQHRVIEAPAVVFDSQDDFQRYFDEAKLEKDFVAVIRFQGPKTNGMPELHKLTPLLAIQQEKGFKVALITDGRMSGASGKIPAAIHLIPEATEGGLIAKIHDGDLIRLDANKGELELLIDEKELEKRVPAVFIGPEMPFGLGRELFESFRRNVLPAESGASIFKLA